ncbi:hypothetical protein J2W25_004631 [Variovorax boronicumulans]|uniref:Uncharacterized protein n=1 Tax=Variovorax boronicumulans TaxID=436515 RepID=A0AAW8E101_9BURK|nr:hypothetical protein [Variovorax boronicumulans]MDP9880302.1 hypothetical protein [Variovorax boronicumulans]MDP9925588.1 hypothetical protein [Variovorax boronicumulans]
MQPKRSIFRGRAAFLNRWGWGEYGMLAAFWAVLSIPLYVHGWGWWSILSLPSFFALIVAAIAVAERFARRLPRLNATDDHLIEFYTHLAGTTKHGTLTCNRGVPHASWTTTSESGTETTANALLSRDRFAKHWTSAGARYLNPYRVSAGGVVPDPAAHYVVNVRFTRQGETYGLMYAIPHESSAGPIEWIDALQRAESVERL